MSILNGFDANTIPESEPTESGLIPEGDYAVSITDTEERPTKAGTGSYLQMEFTIQSGGYTNRKIWTRLNLDNPSEKAVEIARRDLAAICRAVGLLQPKSIVQFIDKPLIVSVKHRAGRGDYGPTAEIVRYSPAGGGASAPAAKPTPKPSRLLEVTDDLPF